MKVGDKVWVETNWQQQLEGEPLIVEAVVTRVSASLVTVDLRTRTGAVFNRHAVSERKEDIVRRVRERLEREKQAAERSIWEANKAAIAAGQALAEFEEKYGS